MMKKIGIAIVIASASILGYLFILSFASRLENDPYNPLLPHGDAPAPFRGRRAPALVTRPDHADSLPRTLPAGATLGPGRRVVPGWDRGPAA